jgi:sterol desaturase/sphingolipid hydroxylase (fatty acid hydroxylase superfamily)
MIAPTTSCTTRGKLAQLTETDLNNVDTNNLPSLPAYWRELKKYHLQHHFADYENGFGVTSRFWDRVFGTELPPPPQPKVIKTT